LLLTAVVDIAVVPALFGVSGVAPRFGRVFGGPTEVLGDEGVGEVGGTVRVAMGRLRVPALAREQRLGHVDTARVQVRLAVVETHVGWNKRKYTCIKTIG